MNFLIQSDEVMDIERSILIEQLDRHKYIHEYNMLKLKDFDNESMKLSGNEIPVGNIPFVTKYMQKIMDFNKQNPIEIPIYLRTEEFLKRKYYILKWDEIPRSGRYFIKDASELKHFSYCGNMESFIQEDMFEKPKVDFDTSLRLSKESLYVVSEEVVVKSEYRVYVIDSKIVAISNYDGIPTIFPDTDLVKKAVDLINKHEEWLKSYTVDIMVTNRGTSIIEVHNFTSCGLYTTIFGSELILGYRQGIDYLKHDNKGLQL